MCVVKIQRVIEKTEQTEDDGSIERIETGRSLKGTYYQKDGTGISFTVELTGAMNSFAAAAGVALATTAMLLTFWSLESALYIILQRNSYIKRKVHMPLKTPALI